MSELPYVWDRWVHPFHTWLTSTGSWWGTKLRWALMSNYPSTMSPLKERGSFWMVVLSSIHLYCLKGFSVSSISNSPGAISCCNLYIFLFISRNHLTQRVSTLFPGPLVSSIRPGIRQNWTSLSKSNNKKLWKTYLVWSWTIFWRLPMYSMNQHTTPDVD